MFELAAQLGTTTDALTRSMSESELTEWAAFANQRMLPQRRLELYLAQIAMMVAVHAGGVKNAKLTDYMFDPVSEADDDEASVEEAVAFFGFNPINKG